MPALGLGILLGWQLYAVKVRRDYLEGRKTKSPDGETVSHNPLRQAVDDARQEHEQLETELVTLQHNLAAARRQREELDEQYASLMLGIDAVRSETMEAHKNLGQQQSSTLARQEQVLTDVDASGEEIEMLEQLSESYAVRINRLTQQVQRQDSELQLLRQTVKSKTSEINEAQAMIDRRDAELHRLIRQRQQREADMKRVRQQLAQRNEELRKMVEATPDPSTSQRRPSTHRKDITPLTKPPQRPRLPSGEEE